MVFDPIERGRRVEAVVCRDDLARKYYRFRPSRFYGGSSVADAVGCNLSCVFCWSWRANSRPSEVGRFYYPQDVGERLLRIAEARGYRIVRVSGGEPTLCWDHLISLLEYLHNRVGRGEVFILETNGIVIGEEPSRARELARFDRLLVRVSIKGCSPQTFSRVTGADARYWFSQLRALDNLIRSGVAARPALVASFCSDDDVTQFLAKLREVDPELPSLLELEYTILYPSVRERLRRAGLRPRVAVDPRTWSLVRGFGSS